jgi:photosystem II stability/assembly factor-like uncharacterized protein
MKIKLIVLVALLLTISGITSAQKDWVTITPGVRSDYESVYFSAPSIGWIASSNGTIRKTTDAGDTWKTVLCEYDLWGTTGFPKNVDIQFGEGGEEGYAVGQYIIFSNNGGRNWEKVGDRYLNPLTDVYIDFDSESGYHTWICGPTHILYCKNFNNDFVERKYGIADNHYPQYIHFEDDKEGWVVCKSAINSTIVYKTYDGGLVWNQIIEFDSLSATSLFVSEIGREVFVGGYKNTVDNDGNSIPMPKLYKNIQDENDWEDVEFNLDNLQRGYVSGIEKHLNSGQIWVTGEFFFADYSTNILTKALDVTDWGIDTTLSYKSGNYNEDDVVNIAQVYLPSEGNKNNIIAIGNGIFKSNDSGISWDRKDFPVKMQDVHFFDSYNGLAVGSSESIFKTSDGGDNWQNLVTGYKDDPVLNELFFINDSVGWICGQKGIIYKTSDAGGSWQKIQTAANAEIRDILFLNEQKGFAVGGGWVPSLSGFFQTIMESDDGGMSWVVSEKPTYADSLSTRPLSAVYFLNDNIGWAAGDNLILKTTNGGQNWNDIFDSDEFGFYNFEAITFHDESFGYACGDSLWNSTDGGESWQAIKINNYMSRTYKDIILLPNSYEGYFTHAEGVFKNWGSWEKETDIPYYAMGKFDYLNNEELFIAGPNGFLKLEEELVTSLEIENSDNSEKLRAYSLSQNYPNPFNPSTIINYQIPKAGFVTLKVYDILGREVAELVNKEKVAGSYKVNFNAENLSSGIYFYQLKTKEFSETKKMMLIK